MDYTVFNYCIIINLLQIDSQKFRSELKKNREKVLGASEGSSKTKRKEVHVLYKHHKLYFDTCVFFYHYDFHELCHCGIF